MHIDRTKMNFMPLIMGPLWDQKVPPRQLYRSLELLSLEYETDPGAIAPLLPEPFKLGKRPRVNVMFCEANGVDMLGGGGYRFAAVALAAHFDGESGHQEGDYVLVMPENLTLPIVAGREWLGMPKFFADLSSIRIMNDGQLRCEASMGGHMLFGIEIAPPLREQNILVRQAAGVQFSRRPSFGYKYIGSLDGPPDADYPTIMWAEPRLDRLWLGKTGHFYVGNPLVQDVGNFRPMIQALQSLPVCELIQTVHAHGSMVLRNDKNGRLR